jgi:RNA polymerase sigma-70 factor (ECF subfamily)
MKSLAEFEKLYDEHVGKVRSTLFRLCPRQDVDDLTQECFLKAWKNRSSFRGDAKASTWFYRIAVNVAFDAHRRKGPPREEFSEEKSQERAPEASKLEAQQSIEAMLEGLSAEQRSVLVLHVLEELSVAEVAETLEIAEGTVKSRLHHAREEAKKFLEKRGFKYEI